MTVEMCAGASLVSIYSKIIKGMFHLPMPMICHCGYFLMKVTVHTSLDVRLLVYITVASLYRSSKLISRSPCVFVRLMTDTRTRKSWFRLFIVRMRLRSLIVLKHVLRSMLAQMSRLFVPTKVEAKWPL